MDTFKPVTLTVIRKHPERKVALQWLKAKVASWEQEANQDIIEGPAGLASVTGY